MFVVTRSSRSFLNLSSRRLLTQSLRIISFYILKQMNVGSTWLWWIKACVCSRSFSMLVNGSPALDFKANRGLCQVDPLSFFLFIIVVKGLVVLMKKTVAQGLYHCSSLMDNLHFDV